jgi:hypothetical protein
MRVVAALDIPDLDEAFCTACGDEGRCVVCFDGRDRSVMGFDDMDLICGG